MTGCVRSGCDRRGCDRREGFVGVKRGSYNEVVQRGW